MYTYGKTASVIANTKPTRQRGSSKATHQPTAIIAAPSNVFGCQTVDRGCEPAETLPSNRVNPSQLATVTITLSPRQPITPSPNDKKVQTASVRKRVFGFWDIRGQAGKWQ